MFIVVQLFCGMKLLWIWITHKFANILCIPKFLVLQWCVLFHAYIQLPVPAIHASIYVQAPQTPPSSVCVTMVMSWRWMERLVLEVKKDFVLPQVNGSCNWYYVWNIWVYRSIRGKQHYFIEIWKDGVDIYKWIKFLCPNWTESY